MKRILLSLLAVATAGAINAQVVDGGFEAGINGGTWTEASTNFGSPLCDIGTCGDCGGGCVANGGSFYSWFGGANAIETGSVEQSVMFPTGTTASLDMMVKIPTPGDGLIADRLEVSVDGNILGTITALDSATYTDYTNFSVDVSAMANGASHTVRIEGFQTTATVFNLLVDDVVLIIDGNPAVGLFEEMVETDFNVYPNPAQDAINIKFGDVNGSAIVTVRTVDGALVSQQEMSAVAQKNFSFSTEGMQNGVYFVEVENDGHVSAERIVVAK